LCLRPKPFFFSNKTAAFSFFCFSLHHLLLSKQVPLPPCSKAINPLLSCENPGSPKYLFKIVSKEAPLGLTCLVKVACPQFDLSDQVLYLGSYKYWLHPIHTIKRPKISISTCAEYPMLYDKTVLIKPASHPNPSLRTTQTFSTLQLINWSSNKEINASMPTGRVLLLPLQYFFLSLSFLFCQ
jgi:hypothetical protein